MSYFWYTGIIQFKFLKREHVFCICSTCFKYCIIFSKHIIGAVEIPMRVRKPSSEKSCFSLTAKYCCQERARRHSFHSIPLHSIHHQPQLLLLYHNETYGVGRDESMSSSGGWCRYKVRPRGSRPPEEEETIQGRSTTVRRRGGSDCFSAEPFPDERRQVYDSHWTATTRTTTDAAALSGRNVLD